LLAQTAMQMLHSGIDNLTIVQTQQFPIF
jgi:hypothetical protein